MNDNPKNLGQEMSKKRIDFTASSFRSLPFFYFNIHAASFYQHPVMFSSLLSLTFIFQTPHIWFNI